MTPTAWAACASIVFLAGTLGLWATLLAGDGRRAAVAQAAKSITRAVVEDDDGGGAVMTTPVTVVPGSGKGHGDQHPSVSGGSGGGSGCSRSERRCTRRTMGWGDPGAVVMCPREDMRALVEGVAAAGGPPETRRLCQTCLVRKPMRSKVRLCWAWGDIISVCGGPGVCLSFFGGQVVDCGCQSCSAVFFMARAECVVEGVDELQETFAGWEG